MKDSEQIIEALLFASPDPLTQKKVNSVFDADPPKSRISEAINNGYEYNPTLAEIPLDNLSLYEVALSSKPTLTMFDNNQVDSQT